MPRVDFDRKAQIYDQLHGANLAPDVARRLGDAASLQRHSRVLDVGAGTGRVSVSFTEVIGCRAIALDSSPQMLAKLRAKSSSIHLPMVSGDAAALPFAPASFDAVVIARLLYFVTDWREALEDAARALKRGGFLLHEWGNGKEDELWVQIREKARSLFIEAGIASPFQPGAERRRK